MALEPFNLKKHWPLAGRKVRTRTGLPVKTLHYDPDLPKYPLYGVVMDDKPSLECWTTSGHYMQGGQSAHDLLVEVEDGG